MWTMTARVKTGCHRLWAMSGTLRGCCDESTDDIILTKTREPELERRQKEHRDFLDALWTKNPLIYADPDWKGRFSSTVTYYTQVLVTEEVDADADADPDSYSWLSSNSDTEVDPDADTY
ncbi:hypothetical protein NXS19_009688 [Fusarium pseudograminearum]|nr:hypothetical protein NXS19_009688 [Fusarium pseudograminearum]